MVLVSIKTTPNKPPSKITTPHNRNKPNISSQPKIVSSKITPLLVSFQRSVNSCNFYLTHFIHYPSLVLETFHACFPVSVKCYQKNGITSLGSVFINKQFAIIPLRTFKCKKRMFSSSADVHHMPKYPVHLQVPKVVDPLILIGHFLSTSVTRSLRGKQLQFTSHQCMSTFLLSRVRTNIYRISRESIFASTEFSLPSTRFKQLQPRIRSFTKIKDIFETSFQHFCSKWLGIIIPKRPQHNNRADTG